MLVLGFDYQVTIIAVPWKHNFIVTLGWLTNTISAADRKAREQKYNSWSISSKL